MADFLGRYTNLLLISVFKKFQMEMNITAPVKRKRRRGTDERTEV